MRGPFGLVVGLGIALLVVAIVFSLAPTVGGSIDDSNPNAEVVESVALYNYTNISVGHRNIGNVHVYNLSTMTTASELSGSSDQYLYVSGVGTVTLLPDGASHKNVNGTYYVKMDVSRWDSDVNSDVVEGGDWFSDNATWVTLTLIGIVAAIIIGMFMRW